MIRYERTGEFREPVYGDYFEGNGPSDTAPIACKCEKILRPSWILRRVEEPPPPRERPGTEEVDAGIYSVAGETKLQPTAVSTDEVLKTLAYYRELSARLACEPLISTVDEAIRRVKVHDRVREWVSGNQYVPGMESLKRLLALLDADAKGDGT